MRSYNEVYHFVPDINSIYKHPYDSLVPLLFDGKHSINAIDKELPLVPKDMIKDDFVKSFTTDTNNALNIAIRQNSLCDWKPDAPVQLCYCDSDEQVSPKNSLVAFKTMKALGAKHVTLCEAGKNFTHTRCALIAILYTKMYFDTLAWQQIQRQGAVGQRIVAGIARRLLQKNGHDHHEDHGGRPENRS